MMQEFVQQIINTVNQEINGIHTAFPGKILSYDPASGLASVLPVMQYHKPDGTVIPYPQISGVPVVFPQSCGQEVTIAYPVKAGDGCLLILAEQSLDYWMYGQDTGTDLRFDLTNAICIPGLFVQPNSVLKEACDTNAVILDAKGTRIAVRKDAVVIDSKMVIVTGDMEIQGRITAPQFAD